MIGNDDPVIWLMAANVIVWLGIGGYLAFLARRQAMLDRRFKQMEQVSDAQ